MDVRLVAGVLAAATLVAPAQAKRATARVTDTSASTLYLDRGIDDGLAPGMELRVLNGRRRAGTCVVEHASESFSSCAMKRMPRRATRVSFEPRARPEREPPVEPLRASVSADELARRRTLLTSGAFPRVGYDAAERRKSAWRFPARVTFRHQTWTLTPLDDKTFHRERVELSLRGARLGLDGLTAFARANVEGRLARPTTTRFRPDDIARVEVYEAALAWRPDGGWGSVQAGRFVPWRVPGVTVLDGALASLRFFGDVLEVGAYGGTVPDLVTGAPSLTRLSTGAFWGAALAGEHVRIGHRGRAGLRTSEALALRAEVEGVVDVSWGRTLFAAAGARAGVGASPEGGPPGLDLAFAQARLHAFDVLTFSGGYRWLGPLAFDVDALGLPYTAHAGAHHADAGARWAIFPWLHAGVASGASHDVTSGSLRAWVGPDLSLPSLLFDLGGVDVGYREELFALAGRYVYSRVWLAPFDRLLLQTTASAWEQPGLYEPGRDVALWLSARWQVLSWLYVDASGRTQGSLPSLYGYPNAAPAGMYGELAVTGAL